MRKWLKTEWQKFKGIRWLRLLSLVFIVALVAALAVSLGFAVEREQQYKLELDNLYKKSYYDAMDAIADLELKLSKLTLAEGKSSQKTLLYDIWMKSEIAESNLSQLSARETEMSTIIKFINQLGDYCYYLSKKVDSGELTEAERQTMDKLYSIIKVLQESFQDATNSVINGESFVGKINEGIGILGNSYQKFINDTTIEYPEMIYDGPFSDGLSDREAKFLKGKSEMSREQAEARLKELFSDVSALTYRSDTVGSIPAYLYDITWKEGQGSVQITKAGGLILEYSGHRQITDPVKSEDECKEIAIQKIKDLGYADMKPVWVTNSHSMVYINFAYEKDDVVYYPDLVKIKIAADTGNFVGLEAANYIYNHTGERAIPDGIKTAEEARAKVSKKLTIENTEICVIPTEWNTEILAYEFSGSYNDGQYFVYIDANTLDEIKVMKVVESDGGMLLS